MKKLIILFFMMISIISAQNSAWECIGPEGGKILSVKQDFANSNIYYAITSGTPSKIFKSTNGGDSWVLNTILGANNTTTSSLIIDEKNPATFYTAHYYQICKTTNSGENWTISFTPIINNNYPSFYSMAIDPNNSNTIFASGDYYNGTTWVCGFFKSINSGQSYSSISLSNKTGAIYSVAVDRQNSNNIYISGYGYVNNAYQNYLLKSTDGGNSFTDMPDFPFNNYNLINDITIDPNNSAILYAGSSAGVFKSINSGASWARVSNSIYNFKKFQVDNRNKIIYACCYGMVWKCPDGTNWNMIANGSYNWVNSVAIDNTSSSRLIIGTDRGLFRTTNSGSSWQACNSNLIAGNISVIKFAPSQLSNLYVGLDDYCGTFKTTNALSKTAGLTAVNWEQLPTFYSCAALEDYLISPTDPNLIFGLEGGG